jgi:hypothetical protein
MGDGSKLVAIALFEITTIEEKIKMIATSFASMVFFALNIKKEKLGNNIKLVAITLFTSKMKRKEKKGENTLVPSPPSLQTKTKK